MGMSQSKFKLRDLPQHLTGPSEYKGLQVYRDLENNSIAKKQILVSKQNSAQRIQYLSKRFSDPCSNLVRIFGIQERGSDYCSESESFTAYFQFHKDSLSSQIQKVKSNGQKFNWEQIQKVGYETLKALFGLHRMGLSHGDINSDNILFSQKGQLKLVDKGLIKEQTSAVYKSQANFPGLQQKTDVFALGILLVQMNFLNSQSEMFQQQGLSQHALQARVKEMQFSCPFQLMDKIKLMLKPIGQRSSVQVLLRMFNASISRREEMATLGPLFDQFMQKRLD